MERLNWKNMKLVRSDNIGRFYCVAPKDIEGKKPIVFINGQMEHHLQAMETFTGATKNSCYQYSWYYMYDPDIHVPYIWVYDYPIYQGDKKLYDTSLFAKSLMEGLKEANLEDVDIMGQSVGGVIGMRAAISPRVEKTVAIHPPILSSPLANLELLREKKKYYTLKQKMILKFLGMIVDPAFGFQQENIKGYQDLDAKEIHEKSTIVGSSITGLEKKDLAQILSDMIMKATGKESDGVVLWCKEQLQKMGFQVLEDPVPTSHFEIGNNVFHDSYYCNDIYQKLILK